MITCSYRFNSCLQGGDYSIRVRTNRNDSRWSNLIYLKTQAIPSVDEIDAIQQKNGSLYINWKEPEKPIELLDHKMTYKLFINDTSNPSNSHVFTVSRTSFNFDKVHENTRYTIQVQVLEQHGYESGLSKVYNFTTGGKLSTLYLSSQIYIHILL